MTARTWWILGAILAALGVGLGAFGAHGLESLNLSSARLENWETAVRYQMYHAFGLLVLGLLRGSGSEGRLGKSANGAGILFTVGILIFSGGLYLLVLTELRWLGAIVPIGGTAMILGWIALAAAGRMKDADA